MRALVARAVGEPLRVEDVELPAPATGEVRVEIRAAGVCHSDLSMVNGTVASPYPLVLGHEAAGVVTEVGDGVSRVVRGEHVVLNWAPDPDRDVPELARAVLDGTLDLGFLITDRTTLDGAAQVRPDGPGRGRADRGGALTGRSRIGETTSEGRPCRGGPHWWRVDQMISTP
ncbi:alcohol dehydrogenase catalytic domain-containing protein [Micromonospora sp. NBC_01405]|uniref:alcohol dehydrogenase catalytic domain-containing protein n=1 Tax=Micromonospora sp. NBC_01405 TaxID=2903589 RepID=UPI00386325FA